MTTTRHENPARVPTWTLGDRLRKAREEAGYTQKELAALLGISRNSVVNYEVGATEPRQLVLREWARLCAVPVGWLTLGELWSGGQKPPGLRYGSTGTGFHALKVA